MTAKVDIEVAEEAILGACFYNPEITLEANGYIGPQDFQSARKSIVFDAMLSLYNMHQGYDVPSVAGYLHEIGKLKESGGEAYLKNLPTACPDPYNWASYAVQVRDAALRRVAEQSAEQFRKEINANPISRALDSLQGKIDEIRNRVQGQLIRSFADLVPANRSMFLDRLDKPDPIQGLRTKMHRLDMAVGGFVGGRLYLIYGSTNMGKSTLVSSLVRDFLEQGPGFIVSTESRPEDWLNKVVSAMSNVSFDKIEGGQWEDAEGHLHNLTPEEQYSVVEAYGWLEKIPCHFLDIGSPTPQQVAAAVRAGLRQYKYKWVVIDSISKMKYPGATDIYTTTKEVADALQDLARETNLPFIVSAQVKPAVAQRGRKIPNTEDAAGGAAIGNNADVVMSLYNHQHFVDLGDADPDEENFPKGTALVRITKHRWRHARNTAVRHTLLDGAGFWQAEEQYHERQQAF